MEIVGELEAMFGPLTKYRPTKTADGEGGFAEALGTAGVLYGAIVVHEGATFVQYRRGEDVEPEDVLLADGEQYRIVGAAGGLRGSWIQAPLEKIDKPLAT